jgi:hypothetical protein
MLVERFLLLMVDGWVGRPWLQWMSIDEVYDCYDRLRLVRSCIHCHTALIRRRVD